MKTAREDYEMHLAGLAHARREVIDIRPGTDLHASALAWVKHVERVVEEARVRMEDEERAAATKEEETHET